MAVSDNGHIRWVFFDFAGTLAFNDPPRAWHYLRVCARRGHFFNRRDVWLAINEVWAAVDKGEGLEHPEASTDQAAYDSFRTGLEEKILDKLGVTQDREAIIGELLAIQDDPHTYTLYPEATPTLEGLRASGYELSIVSNFTWGLPDLIPALGLGPYVSTVLSSARVGYRKPHPKIFQAALDAVGASPEQSLFVGDNYEADVVGPSAHGLHSLLVDRRRNGRHQGPSIALLTDLKQVLPAPATA